VKPYRKSKILGFYTIFLLIITSILGINYSINKLDVGKFLATSKVNVKPAFNEKIFTYLISNCNQENFSELASKIDLPKATISYPYIEISNYKNLIQKQNYVLVCAPNSISKFKLVNQNLDETIYKFTDSLILDPNLTTKYDSSIVLRDALGTPFWWISTKIPIIREKNYNFLSDPKLINKNQILFYASKDPLRGYSDGEYLVYDLNEHKIIKSYFGIKDKDGNGNLDQHDLIVKPDGTAIGMRYVRREDFDLTGIGIKKGTPVLDGEIVLLNSDGSQDKTISLMSLLNEKEIDLGILKFYGVNAPPYDLIHPNSLELDGDSVIVSSRNIDAIHKINLVTGKVVWRLGGNSSTKLDLRIENEYGLNKSINNLNRFTNVISSQHDARMTSQNTLTIFDNGTYANRNPRFIELKINENELKAEVIAVRASTFQDRSNCCGSARKLNSNGILVNWGGDFRFNLNIPSVISTIDENNVESNILLNPIGLITYRAVPLQLTTDQINLFIDDLRIQNKS
jgi:hypothetical protein